MHGGKFQQYIIRFQEVNFECSASVFDVAGSKLIFHLESSYVYSKFKRGKLDAQEDS